jgi:flagellin
MRINNNLMAMNTHRQLGINNNMTSKSLEKLSSGFRINRAGDDAAGLAISEKMRGQIRGLNMASKNAQDGISLIQTAEGGLNEIHAILQRMRELAVQSANDTNVEVDRGEIQKEIDQLASEITRIANNTEFNTQKLLNGGITDTKFHIGANEKQNISLAINAMDAYTLGIARDGVDAKLADGASNISDVKLGDTLGSAIVDEAAITVSVAEVSAQAAAKGTVTVNGVTVTTENNTDAYNDYTVTIADGTEEGIEIDHIDKTIVITADITGSSTTDFSTITATETGSAPEGAGGLTFSGTASGEETTGVTMEEDGTAGTAGNEAGIKVTLSDGGTNTQEIIVATDAKSVNVTSGAFQGISFASDDLTTAAGTINITGQVAAAADFSDPDNVKEAVAPKGIDVSSQEKADAAITVINKAIETVSAERSKLGAMQNRLEHTIKNLDTSAENLQAAESRIRDVDMAKEMMEFTKQNILQQAATAMLAQANMAPQTVLQLLR